MFFEKVLCAILTLQREKISACFTLIRSCANIGHTNYKLTSCQNDNFAHYLSPILDFIFSLTKNPLLLVFELCENCKINFAKIAKLHFCENCKLNELQKFHFFIAK